MRRVVEGITMLAVAVVTALTLAGTSAAPAVVGGSASTDGLPHCCVS